MKKTTIVAILLLTSNLLSANNITPEINEIESQWAKIYYSETSQEQQKHYPGLLIKTRSLAQQYPNSVELTIWQAIIISTNAAFENPFTALESITNAKKILEKAINKNPNALDGAAFVTLGTLYYMSPGWPISYGNQGKAQQLLKKALQINPNSIDANYFYADYLLSQDKANEATKYFKRALEVPSRPEQIYADTQLKKEAAIALKHSEQRKPDSERNKFLSLFYSAQSN